MNGAVKSDAAVDMVIGLELELMASEQRAEGLARELNDAVSASKDRAEQDARAIAALRLDLERAVTDAKSLADTHSGIEGVRLDISEISAQVAAIAARPPTEMVAVPMPQASAPDPSPFREPKTVRVVVRERDGNAEISVADVKIGYE